MLLFGVLDLRFLAGLGCDHGIHRHLLGGGVDLELFADLQGDGTVAGRLELVEELLDLAVIVFDSTSSVPDMNLSSSEFDRQMPLTRGTLTRTRQRD